MERRKRKKRRSGTPRGHHGEEKLRGTETFRRHVYNENGERETIVISVPQDLTSIRFIWSVTPGFEAE